MFSTQGQEVKQGGIQKSLQPGNVVAHIYSGSVKTSKTGKKALELILEGPAIPDFEGWAVDKEKQEGTKFNGQSGRVSGSIYTADFNESDVNKNDILRKMIIISDELGLRKQIDDLSNDGTITSIEEWVNKAIEVLKGHDTNFFLTGTEDEYNGKIIVKLSLPRYKFCSADATKLDTFDKSNKYHYSAYVTKEVPGFQANNDFNL